MFFFMVKQSWIVVKNVSGSLFTNYNRNLPLCRWGWRETMEGKIFYFGPDKYTMGVLILF